MKVMLFLTVVAYALVLELKASNPGRTRAASRFKARGWIAAKSGGACP
jgi:hypothetical protein